MSEISKIGILKPDANISSAKNKKESLATRNKEFEKQLHATVEKLENIENAVKVIEESISPKKAVSNEVARQQSKIREVAAENFTAANKTSTKPTKYVAQLYEQSKTNKA